MDINDTIVHIILFISLYFEIFLLITFFERFSEIRGDGETKKQRELPSASIVVPCYNEEKTLKQTIQSLLSLDYPKDKLKIIVVDDGSTDNTYAIAKQFETNPQVSVHRKENGGKHTAMNLGLQYADTELIGCLDADSYVTPGALKEIIPYFDNPRNVAVTPAIIPNNPRNLLELIQKAEYTMSIFIRRIFGYLNAQFVTPGPFSIFRRSALVEVGAFRKAYNTEDLEMCMRLQSHHYRIENAHTAHIYTNVPKTFSKLFKQRVRWTYGYLKNAVDYRFMLFKPKYGYLGSLILPVTTFSIFGAIYFFGLMVNGLVAIASDKISYISAVGFTGPSFTFSLEWFFINTDTVLLIVMAIIAITFGVIMAGKYVAGDTKRVSIDMFLYLFLYGFIAPLWLGKSVINAVLSRESNWAAEHE